MDHYNDTVVEPEFLNLTGGPAARLSPTDRPPCKARMVRLRFSLVSRYKCESEKDRTRERKGCRTVRARERDRRGVGRGLVCQNSVAPHHPRAQSLRRQATLRPISRSILTSPALAGTAAPRRTDATIAGYTG